MEATRCAGMHPRVNANPCLLALLVRVRLLREALVLLRMRHHLRVVPRHLRRVLLLRRLVLEQGRLVRELLLLVQRQRGRRGGGGRGRGRG
jgi:hypothetical protein